MPLTNSPVFCNAHIELHQFYVYSDNLIEAVAGGAFFNVGSRNFELIVEMVLYAV